MYLVRSTKAYRKAYKRVSRHKNFDRRELEFVIERLSAGEKLDAKYHDHQLTGGYKDYRECHVEDDILLMYQKHENILVLLLVDLGSHDALFN